MADSKLSEWIEKYVERKTKSCQSRKRITEARRTFQESTRKSSWSNCKIHLLDIKIGQFTEEELDAELKKIKNKKAAGLC